MSKIAIVMSEFNIEITQLLLEGCTDRLSERGIKNQNVSIYKVPGAIEVPLVAQMLAKSNQYQAIICLGAVIRGDTDHYDYVCQQVSDGCQRVMLKWEVPVIFGILTTNNIAQAQDRVGGKEGHKGKEAADAALTMLSLMKELRTEFSN